MFESEKDIVIIAYGGAMAGVYCAGVFVELEKNNFLARTKAVYGSSAGAQGCAYFLSGETEKGSSIFWEDLNDKKYVEWINFPKYIWHVLTGKTTKSHMSTPPLIDIQTFVNVEKTTKYLNLEKIIQTKIPFFALVFSLKEYAHRLLPIHENPGEVLEILTASTGGQPGYPLTKHALGEEFIDGDSVYFENLINEVCQKYPDKKVLCILNHPQTPRNGVLDKFPLVFEYILNRKLYGKRFAMESYVSKRFTIEIENYKKRYRNLYFLCNPYGSMSTETRGPKLKMAWKRGRADMQKLIAKGF